MVNPATPTSIPDPVIRETSLMAALLSYLVPGVGQMYQGRIGKGLLFFFCLYGLFFYGMWLGHGEAQAAEAPAGDEQARVVSYRISSNVYLPDTAERSNPLGLPHLLANLYNRPQFAGQFWIGIAAWPAVWHYTHPSGGILTRAIGDFEKTPPEWAINQVQRRSNKLWDLGWVCTVIAGVLNILVIYDAYSGPLFVTREES